MRLSISPETSFVQSAQKYEQLWQNSAAMPNPAFPNVNPAESLLPKRVLEVGFGHGERLLAYAFLFPQIQFYGIEHQTARFMKSQRLSAQYLKNINLYFGEAEQLLQTLPLYYFDEIWILHPDPWPKKRAHKNRFLQAHTFEMLLTLLNTQALGLFIQTDHVEYSQWIHDEWQKTTGAHKDCYELCYREVPADTHNPAISSFHYDYKKLGQPVFRFEIRNKNLAKPLFLANYLMPEIIYQELPNDYRNPITILQNSGKFEGS